MSTGLNLGRFICISSRKFKVGDNVAVMDDTAADAKWKFGHVISITLYYCCIWYTCQKEIKCMQWEIHQLVYSIYNSLQHACYFKDTHALVWQLSAMCTAAVSNKILRR